MTLWICKPQKLILASVRAHAVCIAMQSCDEDILYNPLQELMPTMSSQLGAPATVLAKSAQIKTGKSLGETFVSEQMLLSK